MNKNFLALQKYFAQFPRLKLQSQLQRSQGQRMSQICILSRFIKSKTAALHTLHELFSGFYISQSFWSFPQRDLFCSRVNQVSTCRQLKIFSCNLPTAQIYKFRDSCVANIFTTQATQNNLEITIAGRAKFRVPITTSSNSKATASLASVHFHVLSKLALFDPTLRVCNSVKSICKIKCMYVNSVNS